MSTFRLPYGYKTAPDWPSLYWPFGPGFDPLNLIADIPHSLYYLSGKKGIIIKPKKNSTQFVLDIWRFTFVWSLLFSLAIYLPAGKEVFFFAKYSKT